MSDLENRSFFAHFCSFALSKERKSDRFFCSFEKSEKRAMAHLLFLQDRMSKRLVNRSFEKSRNER